MQAKQTPVEKPLTLKERIISLTRNLLMNEFTGEKIVERLTEKDLIKVNKIMKKYPLLSITMFLRIFRSIIRPSEDEDFYLTYGLFRLFQEICVTSRTNRVSFAHISSIVTQKMPSSNQEVRVCQKLYPQEIQVPESIKKRLQAPQVIGKILDQRQKLEERPFLADRYTHLNRRVGMSFYSAKSDVYFSMDFPSTEIRVMDSQFRLKKTIQTQLQISKRDAIITYLAWSEEQQRLGALLGNYSISLWSMEDSFRYEVNIPLPLTQLSRPYVVLGYMESSRVWFGIDNHPSVYILSHYNYEPEYTFTHFKMVKEKETEKIMTTEIKYRKLLCVAFQKHIFVISLDKRQLVTQLRPFRTSITSLAFSQTYQALFVSTFQNHFSSFQLSQHCDLTEKGRFEGHKNVITLLGVLEQRPVVYSIDEDSVMKLWDIRDFMCYQTFSVLKNIQFRHVIALPEAICLIGSKHFCYRWQRFSTYQEKQIVVSVSQLEKNILIITSKEIRVYNHSNGMLIKVLKGVFDKAVIRRALLIEIRKILALISEEGEFKIFSIQDFTIVNTFTLLPKPVNIYYEKETDLLTIASMGEVQISEFKQYLGLTQKRRIFNNKQLLRSCLVSPLHDLMLLNYEDNPYLYFYSYERAKPLGSLMLQGLVSVKLHEKLNIIYVLCVDKVMIMTYKRNIGSIVFFLKDMADLWEKEVLEENNIHLNMRSFDRVISTGLFVNDDIVLVSSNDGCFQCRLSYSLKKMETTQLKINREMYNPFRVGVEDHNQCFRYPKHSPIIDEKAQHILKKTYIKHKGVRDYVHFDQLGAHYCIADQSEIVFYDFEGICRGCINFKETLPNNWDLHNYSEEQISELEYILQFIQNQGRSLGQIQSPSKQLIEQVITMGMLSPIKSRRQSFGEGSSLREKKMVLDKEKDQKQKMENYMEMRKGEQIAKLKNVNRSSNEKYISESLAFLNINRNKLLLAKGANEPDLPKIKALEMKLNAAVNKDQKKSIISKVSGGVSYTQPAKNNIQLAIDKFMDKISDFQPLMETREDPLREKLKRLDLSLRQSKFKSGRSTSLPVLKRMG